MDEKFEYNPHTNDYKAEYYESLTIVMTPYGKVYITIRSDSVNAFNYAQSMIFSDFQEVNEDGCQEML